jgi:hypothetical protein
MEQEKSPFEEIFKREEKRKEKKKEDEGILGALEKEEKDIFKESSDEKGEEEKYHTLIMDLLEHRYFDEVISIIEEMKEKFGS